MVGECLTINYAWIRCILLWMVLKCNVSCLLVPVKEVCVNASYIYTTQQNDVFHIIMYAEWHFNETFNFKKCHRISFWFKTKLKRYFNGIDNTDAIIGFKRPHKGLNIDSFYSESIEVLVNLAITEVLTMGGPQLAHEVKAHLWHVFCVFSHGLLTRFGNCGWYMRWECRERLAISACITARAWRTCRDAYRDR